jgi:hypothetical protein
MPTLETVSALGFTGTRQGMTNAQYYTVRALIAFMCPEVAHHGCCMGADEQFARICFELRVGRIISHPPIKTEFKALDTYSHVQRRERPYLVRNRDIVDESDLLLACPKDSENMVVPRKGGTWCTIKDARSQNRPLVSVYPGGNLEWERFRLGFKLYEA